MIIPRLNKNNIATIETDDDFLSGRLSSMDESSRNLKKLVDEVKGRMTNSGFARFCENMKLALDNIDKANEITLFRYRKFPLKSHNLQFSLEILTNITNYNPSNMEFAVSIKNRDT